MDEKDLEKEVPGRPDAAADKEPVILRNDDGQVLDPTVVVDEADRTVMLTDKETIIVEKQPQISVPVKLRPRKVYKGMWGPVEVGVLGAALLAVVSAVLLYVFFVAPSNRELEANRTRLANLEKEVAAANEKYGNISDTETQVAKLTTSVSDFESQYLPVATLGRTAIYSRINSLIAAYGLLPTSGPDYSPLETLDQAGGQEQANADDSGRSKFRSFFPGVYIQMTVEGSYTNLRRFIRDIETGREFIVVSAVQLEPSDSEGAAAAGSTRVRADPAPVPPAEPGMDGMMPGDLTAQPARVSIPNSSRGRTHGSVVSLRMEMAAYFRRPAAAAPPIEATQQ